MYRMHLICKNRTNETIVVVFDGWTEWITLSQLCGELNETDFIWTILGDFIISLEIL